MLRGMFRFISAFLVLLAAFSVNELPRPSGDFSQTVEAGTCHAWVTSFGKLSESAGTKEGHTDYFLASPFNLPSCNFPVHFSIQAEADATQFAFYPPFFSRGPPSV